MGLTVCALLVYFSALAAAHVQAVTEFNLVGSASFFETIQSQRELYEFDATPSRFRSASTLMVHSSINCETENNDLACI